jgi:hypothetical protein
VVNQAVLQARSRFTATMGPAHDLIAVHKRVNADPGQRVEELSLNRAAVVFAVAAWQTFVERLTAGLADGMAPPAGDPTEGVYRLLRANVAAAIERLNAPDARKTQGLLAAVNFDPAHAWAFTFEWEIAWSRANGSQMEQTRLNTHEVREELDSWLQVRHKLAHGDTLPAGRRYDQLVTGRRGNQSRLKRRDANRCIAFFSKLVDATAAEAERQFP